MPSMISKSLIASTLYRELRAQVGDHNIGVIPEDCYYRDQSDLTMEERYKYYASADYSFEITLVPA